MKHQLKPGKLHRATLESLSTLLTLRHKTEKDYLRIFVLIFLER
jgi:hypothetical protein